MINAGLSQEIPDFFTTITMPIPKAMHKIKKGITVALDS